MPVNSTHAECAAALPGWIRARDLLAGEEAVVKVWSLARIVWVAGARVVLTSGRE